MSDIARPDVSVKIGKIVMKNPVMTASGTFGYGIEYADLIDLNKLGALVVKGIMVEPWGGNNTPRLVEVPGGLVNSIGLQGPGVQGFIEDYLPSLKNYDVPVIVNIWGRSIEEYAHVSEILSSASGVSGLEINVSCPNVKEGGLMFGSDPRILQKLVSAVRAVTDLTLIVKLPPNVPDIKSLAKAAEDSGADALALINTIPAMVIDIQSRKPVLANKVGGLSGLAIHPVAVKLVWEAFQAVKIPIIGMGGITGPEGAIELMLAGASAVAVGTATFADPQTSIKVIEGINAYLSEHNFGSVADITGIANG